MKRVCIITCSSVDNYGARLQEYALSRTITEGGHRVRVIDYAPWYERFNTRQWYFPGLNPKEWARLVLHSRQRAIEIEKHGRFEAFTRQHVPMTLQRYMSVDQLRLTPPTADVYVAGSDQIWNTDFENGRDPAYYLDFGTPSTRRISYAASFAIERVPQAYAPFVREGLGRFDAISVREASGVDIVREHGRDAVQVCDPAFLLDSRAWDMILPDTPITDTAGDSSAPQGPYLLIYDFLDSDALRAVAQRCAAERGLRIYSASPRPLGYASRNYSNCGPEDFVRLIRGATCVVSNSLHGSIFAMIYRKDFYVVNRADGLNLRMAELLGRYGLQRRVVGTGSSTLELGEPIDYSTVEPLLGSDIERSRQWLLGEIGCGSTDTSKAP